MVVNQRFLMKLFATMVVLEMTYPILATLWVVGRVTERLSSLYNLNFDV